MNALNIVHSAISRHVSENSVAIDATAGRGYDTKFLCELLKSGSVTAFDIQQEALDSTAELLEKNHLNATLIHDSHANMDAYFPPESADVIMFNLGYLPHGDHKIFTRFDSTKEAIDKGLKILKRGGIMSICVYYGGDSGYEEKDALLPYLKTLDCDLYQVIEVTFANWTNDPPFPVFIIKNQYEKPHVKRY